jgi:hypothetical protein
VEAVVARSEPWTGARARCVASDGGSVVAAQPAPRLAAVCVFLSLSISASLSFYENLIFLFLMLSAYADLFFF